MAALPDVVAVECRRPLDALRSRIGTLRHRVDHVQKLVSSGFDVTTRPSLDVTSAKNRLPRRATVSTNAVSLQIAERVANRSDCLARAVIETASRCKDRQQLCVGFTGHERQ